MAPGASPPCPFSTRPRISAATAGYGTKEDDCQRKQFIRAVLAYTQSYGSKDVIRRSGCSAAADRHIQQRDHRAVACGRLAAGSTRSRRFFDDILFRFTKELWCRTPTAID